ncbi:MAG: aspartate/glutamate racemase family protein [Promethearchaeota archaeon]
MDFGETIGLITWRVWFPALIQGNHNYATTYDFPVRIKLIKNWKAPQDMNREWAGWNIPEYVRAAQELEEEGVAAICTNCGLAGTMQENLTKAVNIPVFSSSLLQVPLVHRMLRKDRKVGILTHSEERVKEQDYRLLRSCGIDESIPVVIYGMLESDHADVWRTQYPYVYKEAKTFDPRKVETASVSVAKKMISENRDIGAIVLECTEMPIYAAAIQEATRLPVFDITTLVQYVYNAVVKKKYY